MRNPKELYDGIDDDGQPLINNYDHDELARLSNKIKDGKIILFLGAAVHSRPPKGFEDFYPDNLRPPSVRGLIDTLSANYPGALKDKNFSLSWIAQYLEGRASRRELIEALGLALYNKKPSPLLKALARMNFKNIITTNYDTLYEQALTDQGKPFLKGIYKPNRLNARPEPTIDFVETASKETFIYKIHGDIDDVLKITKNNDVKEFKYFSENDAIVITDEDYIHFILRMGEKTSLKQKNNFNPVPSSFTKAIADPDDITILFIGYSLMDYNLRLLFRSAMWKKDISTQLRKWSVDLQPDPTVKTIFQQHYTISFIEKDAWRVIPFLYEKIFNEPMPI